MNRFLLVALVAILTSQVTGASCFGWTKRKGNKLAVDFDGLDKYLIKKVKNDDSQESNINQLRRDVDKLTGGLRRAAEIFIELASAQQCNDRILEVLAEGRNYSISEVGRSRAWPVIEGHLNRLVNLCEPYVDENVEKRFESSDEHLKHFAENVSPRHVDWSKHRVGDWISKDKPFVERIDVKDTYDDYELLFNDDFKLRYEPKFESSASIDAAKLNFFMTKLAKLAGEPKDYFADERAGHERNFEIGFNKYLLNPCKQFESTLGTLFEGFRALANIKGKGGVLYVTQRSAKFRCLAYTHKVCQAVELVNNYDDRSHGVDFNKQDMLRSLIDWPQMYQHHYLKTN